MTTTAEFTPSPTELAKWYPGWDETYAATLTDTDEVHVDIEPCREGDAVHIRRTVTRKARNRKSQTLLWQGVVAIIPLTAAGVFAREFTDSVIG